MQQKIRIIIIRILIYSAKTRPVMAFIKTRKQLVSAVNTSPLSLVAIKAIPQAEVTRLKLMHPL